MTETLHIGRKISRIRELRDMKQETLAAALGISQQAVSKLEQNDSIDDEYLDRVARALGVSPDAIKNFNEDAAIYNFHTNYDQANHHNNYHCKITERNEEEIKSLKEEIEYLRKQNAQLIELLAKKG
ncbi:MAG TPA: helix-turn-helix transcriptional regulator [Ohtaekwangia sp.]|uniref:helix-turn-helix domain-containing protein n=1 Tax=Ohtaekwangia sp. TaxID=2066019 RepID=UPI002F940C67